jgi:type IV pilus assembly protein PilV
MVLQRGFSLIEGLIAIVIFSIGLLGLAAVLMANKAVSQQAKFRSTAAYLAIDMRERIAANSTSAGSYLTQDLSGYTLVADCSNGNTATCTPDDRSQNDLAEWRNMLQAQLPGGTAVICPTSLVDTGTPSAPDCDFASSDYTIKIWWLKPDGQTYQLYSFSFPPGQ